MDFRKLDLGIFAIPAAVLLLGSLFACGPEESGPSTPVETAPETQMAGTPSAMSPEAPPPNTPYEPAFSATVSHGGLPPEQPNDYQVQLSWHVPPGFQGAFGVSRTPDVGDTEQLAVLPSDASQFVDAKAVPGLSYTYTVTALAGARTEIGHRKISIPKDLVFSAGSATSETIASDDPGNQQVRVISSYARVFFLKGARLVIGATSLLISADEIISHGGVIETFAQNGPDGQPARAVSGDGRNGGDLTILAKNGNGTLTIYSRGENGADGAPGADGAAGAHGTDGNPEVDHCVYNNWGGANVRTCSVSAYARPGEAGAPGTDGLDGHPGFRGGNSGKITVHVENDARLHVITRSLPGRGGTGGHGGRGGDGGQGGAYGGVNGPAGRNGNPGAPGEDGRELPACVEIGDSSEGCGQ